MSRSIKTSSTIELKNGFRFNQTTAELVNFLNACSAMNVAVDDLEGIFLDIIETIVEQTAEEATFGKVKIQLILLKKLSVLFKYMLNPIN